MTTRPTRVPSRNGPRRWLRAIAAATALVSASLFSPATVASTASGAPGAGGAPPETSAPTFAHSYLGGVSGPRPAENVDLAGTWQFDPVTTTTCTPGPRPTMGPMTCEDTPATEESTTIEVPGGGWLKQGWDDLSVADYQRRIRVPDIAGPQATKLAFGAINHRATVWVDGRKVGSQVTAFTPSVFDISDYVEPGSSHLVRVRVEGRKALIGDDGRYTVPEGASWSDDVAQGIFRSADLQVFPAVHISDTFVQTSVADRTMTYDVELTNTTGTAREVRLTGTVDSWNDENWAYPAVPRRMVTVPAHATKTITVGPLSWRAGSESYWWPNVPHRSGYRAQLHDLRLQATTAGITTSRSRVRFGFRELAQDGDHYELNGRHINFRGDSLQGANYDNIDHHGRSDAYDTLPGFLEPSQGNGGWPQVVDNYLRLNFSGVRIHQIPATPYMLDVADARGLMIQDETAIRGSNNRQNFITGRDNMLQHTADLVRRDRNHASVLRWSQSNEPVVGYTDNPGAGAEFDEALYQTIMTMDTTRPISTDSAVDATAGNLAHANYTVFCHYADGVYPAAYTESVCNGPAGKPQGQTEFVWPGDNTPQGAVWFASGSLRMRGQGASDVRPYTLLDLWSSVVPGVKRTDINVEWGYPTAGLHPLYGEDNLSAPWANPHIQLIQNAFNPVAAVDTGFWNANKISNEAGEWPTTTGSVSPGRATRALTVFNDTLHGTRVNVTWSLHVGTSDGKVTDHGTIKTRIALGGNRQLPLAFEAPDTDQPLYLELQVSKPGEGVLFHDDSTVYTVADATP
jgi:hypothetical protein